MDALTLEFQPFLSLLLVLASALVALIVDYFKGNNEHLRERNIELRVRQEERRENRSLEAIEWLQNLIAAVQQAPATAAAGRTSPPAEQQAAETRVATMPVASGASESVSEGAPQWHPLAQRHLGTPATEAAPDLRQAHLASLPVLGVSPVATKQGAGPGTSQPEVSWPKPPQQPVQPAPSSLLETLPKPAWLKKAQEEKAAARAMRLRQRLAEGRPPGERLTTNRAAPVQGGDADYGGLLDRVVAMTTSSAERVKQQLTRTESAPPVDQPAEVEKTPLVAPAEPERPEDLAQTKQVILLETAGAGPQQLTSATGLARHNEDPKPDKDLPAATHETPPAPLDTEIDQDSIEAAMPASSTALASSSQQAAESAAQPTSAFPSPNQIDLPTGFHTGLTFSEFASKTGSVSGIVVVIGVNDYRGHSERLGPDGLRDLMASVEAMIQTLLGKEDFGCRWSEDEFLLVFPQVGGADAHRRLSAISERLWNFQLRSLNSLAVMFSWGAVEVQGESLADAAVSAREQMHQTRRNRRVSSAVTPRKLAVNQ